MNLKLINEHTFSQSDYHELVQNLIRYDFSENTLYIDGLHLIETRQDNLIDRILSKINDYRSTIERVHISNSLLENVQFYHGKELVLDECEVLNVVRVGSTVTSVSVYRTKFSMSALLVVGSAVQNLSVKSSYLSIKIDGSYNNSSGIYKNSLKSLKVTSSSVIYKIMGLYHLKNSQNCIVTFSQDSKIIEDAEHNYKMLRFLSDSINDTTQSHVLYAKMLDIFALKSDKDNSLLLWFEKLTNNYGQSFVLPILWMFVVNSVFLVLFMAGGEIQLKTFFDYVASVLNVNPLNEFINTKNVSKVDWALALDSVRRLLLAALAYQTVTAARRFSFKK